MSCKPTYKGVRYNSLEELKKVLVKENSGHIDIKKVPEPLLKMIGLSYSY